MATLQIIDLSITSDDRKSVWYGLVVYATWPRTHWPFAISNLLAACVRSGHPRTFGRFRFWSTSPTCAGHENWFLWRDFEVYQFKTSPRRICRIGNYGWACMDCLQSSTLRYSSSAEICLISPLPLASHQIDEQIATSLWLQYVEIGSCPGLGSAELPDLNDTLVAASATFTSFHITVCIGILELDPVKTEDPKNFLKARWCVCACRMRP